MNIANLAPYRPTRPRGPIDLKLDGNEGLAPPASLLAQLSDTETLLRRYPDATELEALIAARHGITADRVLVTAGADDALDRVCRAVLAPGDRVVIPVPTFEMLTRYAALSGAGVCEVDWPAGSAYPTDAVLAAINEATRLVCVVSPNNPTGSAATSAQVARLLDAAAQRSVVVLVDAAYAEFADDDPTGLALQSDNAVVLRTLSKAWGLAGLRVGYALGPAQFIRRLRASGHPYPVAAPSLALASARLRSDDEDVRLYVTAVRDERRSLARCLRDRGLDAADSQANFVLARSPRARWLADGLAGLGIAVRSWPGDRALDQSVRITCPGNAGELERLERAIATVLAPQALLFDMDGVLADVSQSYRRTIVDTAASFGAAVTADDVAAIKAEGDASNDWLVTQRLVSLRGIEVPLETVVERFESLYLGDDQQPGSCQRERLLVDREALSRLARTMPLAIVTGRPRAQAESFLAHSEIAELFSVIVAMEDAPAKPDPAPVQRALHLLGVERAWLLGDTVDDIRAARAASVVPLGVAAAMPDDGSGLLEAGAARVLRNIDELEELLP